MLNNWQDPKYTSEQLAVYFFEQTECSPEISEI